MSTDLIRTYCEQFDLPPEQVAEEIRFVLGEAKPLQNLQPSDMQRLESYFYSVYGQIYHSGEPVEDSSISEITIKDWRQFDAIHINLESRLTVITGENGTGKTTILSLLGLVFGENIQLLGTPIRDKKGFRFRAGRRPVGEFEQIGLIRFSSGASSKLGVRNWQGHGLQPHFNPELAPYRSIAGLYLDAQRVIGPYQQLESIPPRFSTAQEIAENYREQLRNLWVPHQMIKAPSLLIKEALVAAAIYGEGNSALVPDTRAAKVWSGFQEVLRRLFPASLGFKGLQVDQGELILQTQSGNFALEAASGGLSAIVTLAWQIYLHSVDSLGSFTVCFDEPENHLHPSLQRTILPALLEAFPDVHFVVATHSPFVVTSTRDAKVFALRRRPDGRVYSDQIDLSSQAFTADEILDEVLGVGVTLPIWAEKELTNIVSRFHQASSPESVGTLVARLESAGLRLAMPEVTIAVADAIESATDGGEA